MADTDSASAALLAVDLCEQCKSHEGSVNVAPGYARVFGARTPGGVVMASTIPIWDPESRWFGVA